MHTPETDGPVQPVVVFNDGGVPAFSALTNDKGFNKSLENGVLWTIDGATGRLLPLTDMAEGAGPLVAGLLKAGGRSPGARYIKSLERREGMVRVYTDLPAPALSASQSVPDAGAAPRVQAATASKGENGTSTGPGALPAAYLYELQDLIRGRKATMPEGSYTTHLFKAGLGKIRKKTGEEAIELLLAQSPEETIAEASDLVYHLMVLLVALEIPVDRIFEDLRRR